MRGLLFDKDATLLDFHRTWSDWSRNLLTDLAEGDAALLAKLFLAIRFDAKRNTFLPDSPVIAGTPEEGVDLLLPLLPHWNRDDLISHSNAAARSVQVHELVPLVPLLDDLKLQATLGIATNDSAASAARHMQALGVADRFDVILGSDSGFGGKPAPGMCLAFADQAALDPSQIAMIGDSTHDLLAGRAAEMTCIGVTSGFASADDLAPYADVILPDISYLPDWLHKNSD